MKRSNKLQTSNREHPKSDTTAESMAPGSSEWQRHGIREHSVQFYEKDDSLISSLVSFVSDGLRDGEGIIVIATPSHRQALEEGLREADHDIARLRTNGRYTSLDAAETLSKIMIDGMPHTTRFSEFWGEFFAKESYSQQRFRIFGEMVALLWAEGNKAATVRLEELWNELGTIRPFNLLCAYPMADFGRAADSNPFENICRTHSRVIPTEGYTDQTGTNDRLRVITQLQQRASALDKEIAERQEAETNRLRILEQTVAERTLQLQKLVSELDTFSYSISHDLRAPLRAIDGLANILLQECGNKLEPEHRKYLQSIASSATRMDRLIQDVLELSRVASIDLKLGPVDLDPLVRGIVESYPDLQSLRKNIHIDGQLPTVLGHDVALTQCLSNMLANATKFVAPGTQPHVRIWAEKVGNDQEKQALEGQSSKNSTRLIRLFIQDNGIGIPKEAQERIFEVFQRLSHDYEGSGVGLYIVKRAVERMGGQVGVDSDPGRGSIFWLELKEAGSIRESEHSMAQPSTSQWNWNLFEKRLNADRRSAL